MRPPGVPLGTLKRILAAVAVALAIGFALAVAWRLPLRSIMIHDNFTAWHWHF
jgi:hypothetical protein